MLEPLWFLPDKGCRELGAVSPWGVCGPALSWERRDAAVLEQARSESALTQEGQKPPPTVPCLFPGSFQVLSLREKGEMNIYVLGSFT